jgi:hypothetical protein
VDDSLAIRTQVRVEAGMRPADLRQKVLDLAHAQFADLHDLIEPGRTIMVTVTIIT